MRTLTALVLAALTMVLAGAAGATLVTAHLTVDNGFDLYVSTDDTTAGTAIGSGNSWPTTYTFTFALQPGVTHYLHIYGVNWGGPGSFIGDFSLSDAAFEFANGGQYLLSDAANWQVSTAGFGTGYQTPSVWGTNGSAPWNFRSGIDAAAVWIWTDNYEGTLAYISTPVYYVPEPATLGLFALGGLLLRRKRRDLQIINS